MTREDFMQGQAYRMPPEGKLPCGRCRWKLEHCELEDWDGYVCLDCGARFTEGCSFDEDCS